MMRQGKLHGKIAGHSEMNGNITNETLSICKGPFKYVFSLKYSYLSKKHSLYHVIMEILEWRDFSLPNLDDTGGKREKKKKGCLYK